MDICDIKCINEGRVRETMGLLPKGASIETMATVFKAISDPSRLKIVLALLFQEHCVCDIAAICNQSESAVSHQLRILRTQRIVKNRRDGKMLYYSLDDDHVASLVRMSLEHINHI